jgi:hypothetical protein
MRGDFGLRSIPKGAKEFSLAQYFNDDWTVPSGIHPFMSEVAHLSHHRGLSQGILAKRYNEVTGARIDSPNIQRHFHSTRLSGKVIAAYGAVHNLDPSYVDLLGWLANGVPLEDASIYHSDDRTREQSLRLYLEYKLALHAVRLIFDAGAIDDFLAQMVTDESFAIDCIHLAAITWHRHRTFGLSLPEGYGPLKTMTFDDTRRGWEYDWAIEIRQCTVDEFSDPLTVEEVVVKLAVVARLARDRFGLDLLGRKRRTTPSERSRATLLCRVFSELYGIVDAHEWAAIQAQLEVALRRRGLPVERMMERLESFSLYSDTDWRDRPAWGMEADEIEGWLASIDADRDMLNNQIQENARWKQFGESLKPP